MPNANYANPVSLFLVSHMLKGTSPLLRHLADIQTDRVMDVGYVNTTAPFKKKYTALNFTVIY